MSEDRQRPENQSRKGKRKPDKAAKADKPAADKAKTKAKKAGQEGEAQAGHRVAVGETARDPNYVPRFKKRYPDVVRPELMKEFGYKNTLQAPRLDKIVLNIGAGEGPRPTRRSCSRRVNDLTAIAGQKAVIDARPRKPSPTSRSAAAIRWA